MSNESSHESPRAIEAEIEQTRERLGEAIDQLLHRTKPSTIATREKTKVQAHFVDPDTGETRTENVVKVAGAVVGVIVLVVVLRRIVK